MFCPYRKRSLAKYNVLHGSGEGWDSYHNLALFSKIEIFQMPSYYRSIFEFVRLRKECLSVYHNVQFMIRVKKKMTTTQHILGKPSHQLQLKTFEKCSKHFPTTVYFFLTFFAHFNRIIWQLYTNLGRVTTLRVSFCGTYTYWYFPNKQTF